MLILRCVSNAVRLVGTERNAMEGRLEVFYNRRWGTVCDHGFNDYAAKVACNGLGFGYVESLSNIGKMQKRLHHTSALKLSVSY